jgi:hypothetical protein
MFAVRQHKNARQTIFLPGVFYYRAPWKMRTAKLLFAVRPKICARQRLKRTAIIVFPVVHQQRGREQDACVLCTFVTDSHLLQPTHNIIFGSRWIYLYSNRVDPSIRDQEKGPIF